MPIPKIGRGDALVRVKACGICSGDVMPWYIEKKAPLVLGHEPSGEIVKVGSDVTSFRPGTGSLFITTRPVSSAGIAKEETMCSVIHGEKQG